MPDVVSGGEILEIANGCWNERRKRYQSFNWVVARGQAIRQIEKVKGGRKDRREEAEHNLTVLFDHARKQAVTRIDTVAREASAFVEGFAAGEDTELYSFASEVVALINGPLSGGFGVIDPSMIISLIMGIINAIRACKNPVPTPVPVPAT